MPRVGVVRMGSPAVVLLAWRRLRAHPKPTLGFYEEKNPNRSIFELAQAAVAEFLAMMVALVVVASAVFSLYLFCLPWMGVKRKSGRVLKRRIPRNPEGWRGFFIAFYGTLSGQNTSPPTKSAAEEREEAPSPPGKKRGSRTVSLARPSHRQVNGICAFVGQLCSAHARQVIYCPRKCSHFHTYETQTQQFCAVLRAKFAIGGGYFASTCTMRI